MTIGYLLVCVGLNCQVFVDEFNSVKACNEAGAIALEVYPRDIPQITSISFKCETDT